MCQACSIKETCVLGKQRVLIVVSVTMCSAEALLRELRPFATAPSPESILSLNYGRSCFLANYVVLDLGGI